NLGQHLVALGAGNRQTLHLAAGNLGSGHGGGNERPVHLAADNRRDGIAGGAVMYRFNLVFSGFGQQFRTEVARRSCPETGKVERIAMAGSGLYKGLQVDRKSTRLNSSHVKISYAVFCLKKKR